MTYFGFLAIFLCIPIALLWAVNLIDARRGKVLPPHWRTWASWIIVAAHCVIAVVYTTPWDNYLVATRVWWYDPAMVTGIIIGWVPIEEYTFFVLQPLLTGAWLLMVARHRSEWMLPGATNPMRFRIISTAVVFVIWLISVVLLLSGWRPWTYMGLLLGWALPPVMIQTAFGADILWKQRKLVALTVIPMTLYLAAADKYAITTGVWTINPEQQLNILLLGRLPIEEFLFFFMTNALIAIGITLVSQTESKVRADQYVARVRQWLRRSPAHKASSSPTAEHRYEAGTD
jgi:lycopene beta-cyclase